MKISWEIRSVASDEFKVYPYEKYKILSGEKVIIGAKVVYTDSKSAKDIFVKNALAASLDLYINAEKQDIDFTAENYWAFSRNKSRNIA